MIEHPSAMKMPLADPSLSPPPSPNPEAVPGHDACGAGILADHTGQSRFDILPLALTALGRMDHRGAVGADGETGDGAGVLTAIPWAVLVSEAGNGIDAEMAERGFGVGSLFLPADPNDRAQAMGLVERGLGTAGLEAVAWREVPTNDSVLGPLGRRSRPGLVHLVVARPDALDDEAFERRLFIGRREVEALARTQSGLGLYFASLSHRTIVYKALLRGSQLRAFYSDLRSREFRTPFAVFHNRFSTNTHPAWTRAQPFRQLAHNGEINTIDGNRRWMEARANQGAGRELGLSGPASHPLLPPDESDSGSLDEALRLLTAAGHSCVEALSMLIPPAWENDPRVAEGSRSFYESASDMMEPWDGPALIAFSDGRMAGAILDRNGLRPARTVRTTDNLLLVASEAGVLDVPEARILDRGRLGPGGFLAVDLECGRLIGRPELEAALAGSKVAKVPKAAEIAAVKAPSLNRARPDLRVLAALGYTREEMQFVIGPMAREGAEPVGSMGDDTPLACLSETPRPLFSFFKQRFAQVTNPAIDPLREKLVMSLRTCLGPAADPFSKDIASHGRLHVAGPILNEEDLHRLADLSDEGTAALSVLFPVHDALETTQMERALDNALLAAVREVRHGATRLLLSDRGIDATHAAIPSLLAVSAIHQRLIKEGLRLRTSLVVESAEPRDDHQVAALLGFGANAVCPYGAFEAARRWAEESGSGITAETAVANLSHAFERGLLKILSKAGISTLRSYQGAQHFEALGLDRELVSRHFSGTPSRISGHGLVELERNALDLHAHAFREDFAGLEEGSAHRYRRKGEVHAFEPNVIKALHALVRTGERLEAKEYSRLVGERPPVAVRDLVQLRDASGSRLPLSAVEPAAAIFPRFSTAAMSLGSLSPEAHATLAVAMNRIGARSNSGEGGEAEENFWRDLPGGGTPNHRIKQVASARFGVTTDYLVAASELQIKIAQGSKPGEGGQLPGAKVVGHIARVRHAPEGVTLISPPPHHDIYSIEDLAQLVHDLKRVNPTAEVSVKLVSSSGLGAIAAGVVKAGADTVVIGGHDGGTGASPLGSIKNAGSPWELGLLDVQETLQALGLRSRVRLRVEGGLKTGHDVVLAAIMGADEFAFGSAALVAAGCVMARQCHLNTCPAGIATQRLELRRNYRGTPEHAIAFFTAIAEEARELLASLGRRQIAEIVGDRSLLEARARSNGKRASRVSVTDLLRPAVDLAVRAGRPSDRRNSPDPDSHGPDEAAIARLRTVKDHLAPLTIARPITVTDRSVGARLAGEVTRRLRGRRLSEGTLNLHFRGSAGQSFGAFAVAGMTLTLEGDANDYVGKGLSGGEIVLRPRKDAAARPLDQVIAGNTVLYGATSGRLFAAGRVGERFAVRMSGAFAVVEGAGDHACEYMTAGAVLILGAVGRNLGAGMTGGIAYVHDPRGALAGLLNEEMVTMSAVLAEADKAWLREACERHLDATASPRAQALLLNWHETLQAFKRVTPKGIAARPVVWPQGVRDSDRMFSVA
jgi:glutamate synthase domain-containing protein 2/glutamate synthase domain-containing protein 1/glutamate synthase domain-containing protein 3